MTWKNTGWYEQKVFTQTALDLATQVNYEQSCVERRLYNEPFDVDPHWKVPTQHGDT